MRGVKLRNEVEKSLADANTLVIGQNDKPTDTKIVNFHSDMSYCDESDRLLMINGNITSYARTKAAVQIVKLPKDLPDGFTAFMN